MSPAELARFREYLASCSKPKPGQRERYAWESAHYRKLRAAVPLSPDEREQLDRESAIIRELDWEHQARQGFRSRIGDCPPLEEQEDRGGQSDLPRPDAMRELAMGRDDHPLSDDWKAPALARWHDAWDSILYRWDRGETILASEYPAECVSKLADPGIRLITRDDGKLSVRKVAFIRLEGEQVIPLDQPERDGEDEDPYPGWDRELMGDPEKGRRLGRLTREHALAITLANPLFTHEQARALFHSPGYRAAHPELDGCKAVSRENWKKARQRNVELGLVHKPEPDQHYVHARVWHTVAMPYAPGPAPDWQDPRPMRKLVRAMRRAAVVMRT